jgi:hypothetical protein
MGERRRRRSASALDGEFGGEEASVSVSTACYGLMKING